MPPWTLWHADRRAVMAALTESWNRGSPDYVGRFRMLASGPTGSRGGHLPACPGGRRARPPSVRHRVLRIEGGRIAEIVAFHEPALFPAFGLPATLPAEPADEG